jgi:hypothetical protein
MPSREQRRAERRKRKTRGAERRAETAARRAEIAERYERRNREARERLEPLAEGERPAVVTVSAVIAAVIAITTPLVYVILIAIDAGRPPLVGVLWTTYLMGMAAWGLWRARYWAVLGFDVVLAFLMIAGTVNLIASDTLLRALVSIAVVAGSGTLFWFMVKAMARIQMPERRPPR